MILSYLIFTQTKSSQNCRSNDARDLLLSMVESGATVGSGGARARGYFYIPRPSASQSQSRCRPLAINDPIDELICHKLVQVVPGSTDDHYFEVLARGLSGVILMQTASRSGTVYTYKRTQSISKPSVGTKVHDAVTGLVLLTRWELQMVLSQEGWKLVQSKAKKMPPITQSTLQNRNIERTYYCDQTLGKDYLICLVLLDRLLAHGLKEFHHYQLQNYYGVLLESLQSNPDTVAQIIPNQPMVFYKEHKTRNHENTQKGMKRKLDGSKRGGLPEDFEIEHSLSAIQPPPTRATAAKSRPARGRGGRGKQKRSRQEQHHEDTENANSGANLEVVDIALHDESGESVKDETQPQPTGIPASGSKPSDMSVNKSVSMAYWDIDSDSDLIDASFNQRQSVAPVTSAGPTVTTVPTAATSSVTPGVVDAEFVDVDEE